MSVDCVSRLIPPGVVALLSGQNASDLKASSSRGIGMNA